MVDKKISELADYTPPIDTDLMSVVDITTATTKRITWANIKAALKTYFDTLYMALTGNQTIAGVKTFSSSPVFPSGTINAGDNLLLNPEFQVGAAANLPLYWTAYLSPTSALAADTLFPALSGNQLTITATGAASEGVVNLVEGAYWLKVKPSTTYTFSIDYKVTAGDTFGIWLASRNEATVGTIHINNPALTATSPTRVSYTFTTDVNANNIVIILNAQADSDIVTFSHPKLEEGSVATPFEPCHARTRSMSKIITATRDMTAASGDVSYTGLDFTPTSISVLGVIPLGPVFCSGFADSAKTNVGVCQYGANTLTGIVTLITLTPDGGTNQQSAIVKTYDTNVGFTLTWTKTGSPTGTAILQFLCFR